MKHQWQVNEFTLYRIKATEPAIALFVLFVFLKIAPITSRLGGPVCMKRILIFI